MDDSDAPQSQDQAMDDSQESHVFATPAPRMSSASSAPASMTLEAELGLSVADKNSMVGNGLAMKVFINAKQRIESLRQQLEEQTVTLASVLQQQTAPAWKEEEKSPKHEFENLYYAQVKQNNTLTLQLVKLRSQLDDQKRTTAHALAAVAGGDADASIMEDADAVSSSDSMANAGRAGRTEELAKDGSTEGLLDVSSLLLDMTRKMQINAQGCEIEAHVLLEFLEQLREQKEKDKAALSVQLEMLRVDIASLKQQVDVLGEKKRKDGDTSMTPFPVDGGMEPSPTKKAGKVLGKRRREYTTDENESQAKKTKIFHYMGELQNAYFDADRKPQAGSGNRLLAFSQHLSRFTTFTEIKPVRTFGYQLRLKEAGLPRSPLIASAKLDKDEEFFALAGPLSEIHIFPYCSNTILEADSVSEEELAPVSVMVAPNSLAQVAWSHHSKGQLASADYQGSVGLWDCSSSALLTTLRGHDAERKVWSVDYSPVVPGMLVSGSEDCSVRLWDVGMQQSTAKIPVPTHVCQVKCHPTERKIAFGASNHMVYVYDVRKTDRALCQLAEHTEAVCGVEFLNATELVTQAVDGSLKLWDLQNPESSVRTFKGHVNSKRFTGLTVCNELIACGSEDNSVTVYNKLITSPVLRHSFNTGLQEQDQGKFASAVCFNKYGNVLLAGNSCGVANILRLV